MPDRFSKEIRAKIMRSIKSSDTKPERMLRSKLWSRGWRYRLHSKLAGSPDIVFYKFKVAIFVDGCFWHKCPKCFRPPKSNTEYWDKKLQRNVERDEEKNELLEQSGWIVLRFWEHEILNNIEDVIGKIERTLFLESKKIEDDIYAKINL